MLIRPHEGQRPPPPLPCLPCTWLLLTPPSGKSQGVVGWFGHGGGGYHDLSRHCSLLPWCCQGDIMNFDLKCSWLGATLVIQGRHFFFFLIFRVGGGEMRRGYGCDPHNTQSALRDHRHEFVGKTSLFYLILPVRIQDVKLENNILQLFVFQL